MHYSDAEEKQRRTATYKRKNKKNRRNEGDKRLKDVTRFKGEKITNTNYRQIKTLNDARQYIKEDDDDSADVDEPGFSNDGNRAESGGE